MSSRKDEAINLLSFDGGGVRGVASLVILHEIMIQIKENLGLNEVPKPCDYFHMIGGTSTGGLIAIMLGRLRMSTEEALQEYDRCAEKIFSSQNKKWTTATEKFRATALQEVIENLVRRCDMGENLQNISKDHDAKGHCFVCVMPANQVGEPRRLRSFASNGKNLASDIKIWEAARATTAASFFFKPMRLRVGYNTTEEFIDAAIGCNNPAEYLLLEAADYIGTSRRLGCLISIGTGTRAVKIGRASNGLRNILQAPKYLKELIGTLKNTATDGEETHRRLQTKLGVYPNAYFRFNVPDAAEKVRLHDYLKMTFLKDVTAAHLSSPLVAAQVLTAAGVLARNLSEHGLTLGHIHGIDKDQVVLSTQEVHTLGHASRFFTGRDDILANFDACFPARDTGGKPRREFLLYGMGGVGKTQIALKAADDFEDRFKYIFHIDGTNTMTTSQSYASICQEHCPSTGTTNELKDLALQWIERLSDEWLIIYDNYSEKERFEPILPRRNKGSVIYTSRSQGFLKYLPANFVCEVKPLAEGDAINLLLKIADREDFKLDAEELKAVQELVAHIGYLPLAIENVGAYLREDGCNATTYLRRFQNRLNRPKLLSKPESDGSLPVRPALYTALDLSYDAIVSVRRRMGQSSEGMGAEHALKALNLLCFYHNEAIPSTMVMYAAEQRVKEDGVFYLPLSDLADDPFMDATALLECYADGTWNIGSWDQGVRTLQRFSLIQLLESRSQISMHVMVQGWAQDRMDEQTRRRQALAARIMLVESIRPNWNRLDQAWLRLLPPHVNACMAHQAATIPDDRYQADLDYKLGWYYKEEKQFSSAVEHWNRALRLKSFEQGVHGREITQILSLLGNLYRDMGHNSDAEFTHREALDRSNIQYVDFLESFETFKARRERGRKRRARRRRLDRLLHLGNTNDKNAGDNQDEDDKQYKRGPLWESIKNGSPKKFNTDFSRLYADLSRVLADQGKLSAGQACLEAAITFVIDAYDYDPQHTEIMILEDELIREFKRGGDRNHWDQRHAAVESFSQHEFKKKYVYHEYAFVLPIGYASYLVQNKGWMEAYDVLKKAFDFVPRFYGGGDRRTLYLLREMAWCLVNLGLFEVAEEHARTAVDLSKDSYGQWHMETVRCLEALSHVLMEQTMYHGPGSEFFSVTQEAYDSIRVAFSEDHPLAKQFKLRLDILSKPPRLNGDGNANVVGNGDSPDQESDDENEFLQEFYQHMDKIWATNGKPDTMEEAGPIVNAEYREFARMELQAKPEDKKRNKKARKNGVQKPAVAEGGLGSTASSAQGAKDAVAGIQTAKVPRIKERRKGKEKAKMTLSPIPEAEPIFYEVAGQEISECGPGNAGVGRT